MKKDPIEKGLMILTLGIVFIYLIMGVFISMERI
jgi:hypothetical protein